MNPLYSIQYLEMEKPMNRKTIFRIVIAISMIALAACSTAAATSTITTTNAVAPTIVSNTTSNATSPTAASDTTISMDPNLACSGGKTSATVTPELTEGPYYKSGSPELANLYQTCVACTEILHTSHVHDNQCSTITKSS